MKKVTVPSGWWREALCAAPQHKPVAHLFTQDVITDHELAVMRNICSQCPVQQACLEVARGRAGEAAATAGCWGGKLFNRWGGSND